MSQSETVHAPPQAQPDAVAAIAAAPASPLWAALAALCAVARVHQVATDPATLAHQLGLTLSSIVTTEALLRAARQLGLKARLSRTTPERLVLTPLPALTQLRDPDGMVRTVTQCARLLETLGVLKEAAQTPQAETMRLVSDRRAHPGRGGDGRHSDRREEGQLLPGDLDTAGKKHAHRQQAREPEPGHAHHDKKLELPKQESSGI